VSGEKGVGGGGGRGYRRDVGDHASSGPGDQPLRYTALRYITQEGERRDALLSRSVNNGAEGFLFSVDNSPPQSIYLKCYRTPRDCSGKEGNGLTVAIFSFYKRGKEWEL